MTATILITGFGPFPGAPFNPTEPLAVELAQRRHPAFANVRRVAHVFRTSYQVVDRELPTLIAREKPAALSHDAGHYLCNYLCWRAAEAARAGALRLAAFVHVPGVRRAQVQPRPPALTLDDLAEAGEAIVRTAVAAAR